MSDNESNPLREYFQRNPGRLIHKWLHYFDLYHRHLARYRGTACTMVEIGVFHGGSLQMWRDYLGPQARIIGIDIEPRAQQFAESGTEILIGDQADRAFLRSVRERAGPIDILIDDGGHTQAQQLVTMEELYGSVKPDGVYIVEDTHTSYWREYGGAYHARNSFMEFTKTLIDQLNAWHSRDPYSFPVTPFTRMTQSMHFYDSVVVFEKGPHEAPQHQMTGEPVFWLEKLFREPSTKL